MVNVDGGNQPGRSLEIRKRFEASSLASLPTKDLFSSTESKQNHINQIALHGNTIYESHGPIWNSIRLIFVVNPNNS
jgi:hypothetical protein